MPSDTVPEIIMYTKGYCPYCRRAKILLREKGVTEWTEYDLEVVPEKRKEMEIRSNGGTSVPQIFINGQHIGGSDDLVDLDLSGGLDPLLTANRPQ